MIEDLHTFASKDSNYVALQGYESRVTVNLRVSRDAIDDLPGVGGASTEEQRIFFVRHNIDAFREIAEMKLERGEGEPEDLHGRSILGVRIGETDFADYLSRPGNRLSYAAFGAAPFGLASSQIDLAHAVSRAGATSRENSVSECNASS